MNPIFPLLALRAFTEVGRHGSVKTAAAALGVTPGAVSQHIRQLEERLGVTLFIRQHHRMRLSDAGAEVYPTLQQAFDQIEQALHTLQDTRTRRKLRISTVPSFAASWLVPRLAEFHQQHPDIEVRVDASPQLIDLRRDRVDLAIRHGLGHYPGYHVETLMAPALVPVASPDLLAHGASITQPADCLQWPLLHDADRADWPLWFQAHGLKAAAGNTRGTVFEDDYLLIRAAVAGLGLALIPQAYATEEIQTGRLIQVLDLPWPSHFAYYLVTLPEARPSAEVQAFTTWIQAAVAREGN